MSLPQEWHKAGSALRARSLRLKSPLEGNGTVTMTFGKLAIPLATTLLLLAGAGRSHAQSLSNEEVERSYLGTWHDYPSPNETERIGDICPRKICLNVGSVKITRADGASWRYVGGIDFHDAHEGNRGSYQLYIEISFSGGYFAREGERIRECTWKGESPDGPPYLENTPYDPSYIFEGGSSIGYFEFNSTDSPCEDLLMYAILHGYELIFSGLSYSDGTKVERGLDKQ